MLVAPIVGASNPTFQFNKEFDLKRTCDNGGLYCPDSTFNCNITLIYPDGNIMVKDQTMTNNFSFRNITISQSLNNQLGTVSAIQNCNNVSHGGVDTYDVDITADGKPLQPFPVQFVVIIFSFLFIVLGVVNDRLRMFKHLGSILLMIMGVLTIYPGYNFINYATLLGKGLGFTLVGLGFYFLIEDSFSRAKQEDHFEQDQNGRAGLE